MSVALIGNECLSNELRMLAAIEIHQHAEWYASHNHFEEVKSMLSISTTSSNLFTQSLSDIGCKKYTESKSRILALQEEAKYISINLQKCIFSPKKCENFKIL